MIDMFLVISSSSESEYHDFDYTSSESIPEVSNNNDTLLAAFYPVFSFRMLP